MLNHDELLFEAKEDVIEETAKLVRKVMVDVAAKYFPECTWGADYETVTHGITIVQSFDMYVTLIIELQLRWYDLWVGLFVDMAHKTLYICPLPMCVIKIVWGIRE
jgi:hypothetical protein